jgi:hypothetical protein
MEKRTNGVVLERRRLTMRQRRDDIWIAKLRRQNCFDQLVKKLVSGESAAAVGRWLHELNPEGELKDCSEGTLRHYVSALAARVKANLSFMERKEIEPLACRFVMNEFEKQKEGVIAEEAPMSEAQKRIWKVVTDAVKKLDSETMLKYVFVLQQGRVEMLLKMENRMNLLMPDGWKNIAVLKDIAAEIRKYEVGEQYLKGKGVLPYGGPVQGGLVPHQDKELSEVAQTMSQFDETDRNLMRAATARVLELIQEEAGAGFKISELEDDAQGKVAEETEVGNSNVGP